MRNDGFRSCFGARELPQRHFRSFMNENDLLSLEACAGSVEGDEDDMEGDVAATDACDDAGGLKASARGLLCVVGEEMTEAAMIGNGSFGRRIVAFAERA